MKGTKKLTALILSLVMALGICGNAFAKPAAEADTVNVTVVIDYANAVKFAETEIGDYYGDSEYIDEVTAKQKERAEAAVAAIKAKLPDAVTTVEVSLDADDANALAALMDVASQKNLTVDNPSGTYVAAIQTLGETSTGMYDAASDRGTGGWMFNVLSDGETEPVWPRVPANEYTVQSGDVITWAYTCDWGVDLKQDIWSWE